MRKIILIIMSFSFLSLQAKVLVSSSPIRCDESDSELSCEISLVKDMLNHDKFNIIISSKRGEEGDIASVLSNTEIDLNAYKSLKLSTEFDVDVASIANVGVVSYIHKNNKVEFKFKARMKNREIKIFVYEYDLF